MIVLAAALLVAAAANAQSANVSVCGTVTAYAAPGLLPGLIVIGGQSIPIAVGANINGSGLITVGSNLCLSGSLNALAQLQSGTVTVNASTSVSVCGVVSAYTAATASLPGSITIGGQTFPMPDPFLVLATQNPIENEGVYPLPEAQRDRFLFKIIVDYPTAEEEREIVYRMGVQPPTANQALSPAELVRLQGVASRVFVHHSLVDYVVRLVIATRTPGEHGLSDVSGWVAYGASPRASLGIIAAGRALALVRGRDYVLPQDVVDVAPDVLRHRLVLSYDALADGVPIDHIVTRVLQTVPLPQVSARPQPAVAAARR